MFCVLHLHLHEHKWILEIYTYTKSKSQTIYVQNVGKNPNILWVAFKLHYYYPILKLNQDLWVQI
jgi:hypothetical protein